MTRQEAIEALWVPNPAQSWAMGAWDAAHFVDRLVALGMLKLDEPKSAEEVRAMKVFEYAALDGCKPDELVKRLGIAGLRIVEK